MSRDSVKVCSGSGKSDWWGEIYMLLGYPDQTEAPNKRCGLGKMLTLIISKLQECLEKNCSLELLFPLPKDISCFIDTRGLPP
jgi:hypothetical protein